MEIFHLRYFVAVAEELNFAQAARRLHMSASPLSQRIKDLERELAVDLFDRSTHGVLLTAAGAALLPLARDLIDRFQALPWRIHEAVRADRRDVLVGMPPALHPALRAKMRELERRCENCVDLRRWPGSSPDLASGVRDGTLAIAFVRLPLTDPALEVVEVMSEQLGAVVPVDRFPGRTSVALEDLVDLPYVSPPDDLTPTYFAQLEAILNSAGVRKRIRLNHSDLGGSAELISTGLAFTISMLGPESAVQTYGMDNLAILPVDDLDAALATGLIWRKDRAADGGDLAELVRQAREVFDTSEAR